MAKGRAALQVFLVFPLIAHRYVAQWSLPAPMISLSFGQARFTRPSKPYAMKGKKICDANEAVATIAFKTNEICAIYPITPSSPMGETADALSAAGEKNIWGDVPQIVEMQSEGGAAGAVHGALQGGALTSTFTASQGLLLMIPNMYKIAGELLPTVFHIASRTVATHALSIFGDHSDVMACKPTGFAMLFAANAQEAMDFALMAQVAALKSRVPFLHVFDGFRTSHEILKLDEIPDEVIRAMMPEEAIRAFKSRALNPEHPHVAGTAQNPDVFFQAREAANVFYARVPELVKETMLQFAALTGRKYGLFDYVGHPQAERVLVLMGSGCGAVRETVDYLLAQGEKVGAVFVRLYAPFSAKDFLKVFPEQLRKIAVLDRTKEPGSQGEPLYQDVLTAWAESGRPMPQIVGGRYGLSSKEFNPAMVKAVFEELKKENPKKHFTIGIRDDVTFTSLDYDPDFELESSNINCLFYGLGSDGTVSANKNSIKIIGETTDHFVQGYFVYDSKKAGGMTISHLRFGKQAIHSTYLIRHADFLACHQFNFLYKFPLTDKLKKGGTFLLNAPYGKDEVWDKLPRHIQQGILDKDLTFYVINASKVARELQLGKRTNTILQTCFFAISGILERDEALRKIKDAIVKSYSHKGDAIVRMNFAAVDKALEYLQKVDYPREITSEIPLSPPVPPQAPEFVQKVTGVIIAGRGDELPVSAFPVDGVFPSGTTQWEKRDIADLVPDWDAALCTQCNKCVLICPHAAIRAKVYRNELLESAPASFKHLPAKGRPFLSTEESYTLQVSTEDCTGCHLCVEICPAVSKEDPTHKALDMVDKWQVVETEKIHWDFFEQLTYYDRSLLKPNVKGSQFFQPLMEFSGACAGCGETPYIKLATQLFGDRMIIANATGCSSIYGGNSPTTPYTTNSEGRGPAWANSLFEDNAEFGLGIHLAAAKKREKAHRLLSALRSRLPDGLYEQILANKERDETEKKAMDQLVERLKSVLAGLQEPQARDLLYLADYLKKKSVWIIGGDGWAYDIGFGGLDHVLASGANLNILVLDTEVYSNTGGQSSKATPVGAAAKFAISGKRTAKKDLGLMAISYGNVYVAQVALMAKDTQTIRAFQEAEAYEGVSLIIAYSNCIEHGYDMGDAVKHQHKAVETGYWPLYRFNPAKPAGSRFSLDSKGPVTDLEEFMKLEARFTRVARKDPALGEQLLERAKEDVAAKWERLEAVSGL